ncbi:MAG: MBL fold metallo-hydrolase, partial [Boseongicola sp.]|nr:MBL fold metallo-hydrolase [Boseongicola sp.]
FAWESTVGEQKAKNVHVGGGKPREDFVEMRETRDASLGMPKLIVPSLQVNMRAGNMPEPDDKGDVFLKIPVNKL